jgi:peptide/nickel transport system substrate-binding protein
LFDKPTPFWANAFVGQFGALIPKHLFADYAGARSRDAPNNLRPIGTGPYKFVEFKPGDIVRGELNPDYHLPNRPYFDSVEMKGGGDAVSAARAVIQTGEYDYAWNMQVEDEVLLRLENGGKGKTIYAVGADIETIFINLSDPNIEVDGERSSIKTKHPFFSDPRIRKALSMLVNRDGIQKVIYGRAGSTTANFFNGLQGSQAAGRRRLETWSRRHPRKGRKKAKTALPDLNQWPTPEDASYCQANMSEGRDRRGIKIGGCFSVLLFGCRESRHHEQVLC